jgi:small subunit ribosomal protein S20
MPHTQSAWKRNRKAEKRRKHNKEILKGIKRKRKAVAESLKSGDATKIAADTKAVQQVLDRAADKGYIHKNKAARLKSRLAKRAKALATAGAGGDKK